MFLCPLVHLNVSIVSAENFNWSLFDAFVMPMEITANQPVPVKDELACNLLNQTLINDIAAEVLVFAQSIITDVTCNCGQVDIVDFFTARL